MMKSQTDGKMKKTLSILIISITLLSGCADSYTTISGIATPTKDGYYLSNNVLEESEIKKYDPDYKSEDYDNTNIEITGKIKEVETPCETLSGEISQCRAGKIKYIYDIKEIKIIKK